MSEETKRKTLKVLPADHSTIRKLAVNRDTKIESITDAALKVGLAAIKKSK